MTLDEVAPAFIDMAHGIVWASVSTVDARGRRRSRVLHPYWQWDGSSLVGWVATGPTPTKRAHLEQSPFAALRLEPWRLGVFPGTALMGCGGDVLTWSGAPA